MANSSMYDLWFTPWGVAQLMGFSGIPRSPFLGRCQLTPSLTEYQQVWPHFTLLCAD